jgi:hypothetical protein
MSANTIKQSGSRTERHDAELVNRFTRIFHRHPSQEDVARVRRADARLRVRMQHQARRRIARLISAP